GFGKDTAPGAAVRPVRIEGAFTGDVQLGVDERHAASGGIVVVAEGGLLEDDPRLAAGQAAAVVARDLALSDLDRAALPEGHAGFRVGAHRAARDGEEGVA